MRLKIIRLIFLVLFFFYPRGGKWFPSNEGGGGWGGGVVGMERLSKRKQTELISQALCLQGCFSL